jgi:hypothetical protein
MKIIPFNGLILVRSKLTLNDESIKHVDKFKFPKNLD